jgi:hypothetical protein
MRHRKIGIESRRLGKLRAAFVIEGDPDKPVRIEIALRFLFSVVTGMWI